MNIIPVFLKELALEVENSEKMLAIVPNDKFDWRPHPKSMNIQQLTTHIAEIPGWVGFALTTSELDFDNNHFEPNPVHSSEEALKAIKASYENSKAELSKSDEARLEEMWTMRKGEQIYSTNSKAEVFRMALSQLIHHRAQLGVYLRLLNVAIPGVYGPSADDLEMH
jgi:uncharacterized damage-inducible protein DinB